MHGQPPPPINTTGLRRAAPDRLAKRRLLGGGLAAASIAYVVLLTIAYLQVAPPSSLFPDLREIDRLVFQTAKPVSRIERLLEAKTGEMSGGGTMRPAFTNQSTGWEEVIKTMTADELALLTAQREAERLALLDWIWQGASRTAYDADDYSARDNRVAGITATYLIHSNSPSSAPEFSRIRIRTLINDRCATCHSENGRHDTARFIELDTYDRLQPRLRPETNDNAPRRWLLAALLALPVLAIFVQPVFWRTSHSRRARIAIIALTSAALGASVACWLLGQAGNILTAALLVFVAIAAVATFIQVAAALSELFSQRNSEPT
jgi:hypothetical protein